MLRLGFLFLCSFSGGDPNTERRWSIEQHYVHLTPAKPVILRGVQAVSLQFRNLENGRATERLLSSKMNFRNYELMRRSFQARSTTHEQGLLGGDSVLGDKSQGYWGMLDNTSSESPKSSSNLWLLVKLFRCLPLF